MAFDSEAEFIEQFIVELDNAFEDWLFGNRSVAEIAVVKKFIEHVKTHQQNQLTLGRDCENKSYADADYRKKA